MPAFVKIGDIKGEATDQDHKDWIIIEAMTSAVSRSIPSGAKDQQRTKGETVLADINLVRQLDKSSTKLQEACASGKFFPEVEIHFCTTGGSKQGPFLKYKMKDVIVTGYSFHGNSSGAPLPSEEVSLGFTEVEWTYVIVDPKDGKPKGNVPGKYSPGTGKAG